ncbi:MAG: amino acid adenylation domain-containing protein, partial [bacterium]|nr:amino acid adenylation domain-containing protein [bacterium]
WFLDQVLAVRTAYNMPAAVRFRGTLHLSPSGGTPHLSPSGGTPHLSPSGGTLSVAVLERSCREIVHRHEVLRTAFPAPGGRPRQEIAPAAELDLPVVDLAGTTSETRETETRRLMRREVDRPFDLARGPLLRLTLLRLADDDHLLLLSVHHIVFDEWSHGILLRELTELYAAFLDGGSSPLPELAVQYADFALWQRRALGAEVIGPQLAYWRAQLAGIEPCELPPDRPRSAGGSRRSGVGARRFDAELESLRELGLSRGASWFMTLLAAFFTLLHRLTGRRDLVVGTPVAGRNREEIERLIGFFVNTLVLRARVDGNPCFPEFLDSVRETALGAYARQEVPFERLVDELAPNRELGRNPLFQIMFAVHGEADGRRRLPGLHLDFPQPPWPAAKFDLELHLDEENGAVGAVAVYDRGLFEPTTIDRLTSSLGRVLRRLAERPDTRLGELPLMTSPERHQLLVEWNDRLAGRDPGECLHQLFEAQVSRTPSAVAVACGDRQLSYGELDRRAGALARQLTALGVGPEARIGLCAERSLELVVGLLAVVKAGGAYVPLDPAYPPEHLEFILRDAGITVLLDETRLSERLPATGARVVSLDSAVGPRSGDRPAVATVPGNAAYVIYTSGSTGRPKGVVVTHANAVRLFAATEGWFRFGPGDVWTLFHSYAFDFSVWELWGALLYGGRLEVVPHAVSRAPAEFLRLLEEKGVTVLNQTPSAFRLLMTAEPRQGLALRLVVFGGEALEPRSLRPWFDRHGDGTAPGHGPRLVNMYGITETTVHVTLRPLEAADARGAPSSPIGVALAHLDAVVLDRYQQPLPIGAAGELHLAGAGLARGYLARPALTAARFVPNPFATVAGERLYRTGDLVRRLPDGELEYLGRVDQQIKIRGFRIEPGEIEAVLRRHPAVRDAVVVARENPGGERQLAACVVEERATSDSGLSVGPLREWVERKLPGHMVPALFVFLEALPLTPSGKLDRAALGRRLPSTTERSRLARRYIAPRGPVESALARIWAEVLGVERVGADDNFFELGGDSILSIRIVARANEEGLRLAPRDLFARKTVAGLAAVVGREASIAEQGPITGPVPLTPIQSWFFARRLPEPWHFNQAMLVEQRRPLRPQLLAAAFAELLRHHDALRLRFTPREEGWQQSGVPWDGAVPFVRIDLSRLTPVGQARAYAHAAPQIQASLDLAAGPLLRLVRFEPGRLLMVIHHLAVDAVSWRILLADLDRALRRLAAGRAPAFPPKATSFKAWAEGLRVYARSEGTRRELDFWRAQERPAPLPVDFAGGDNTLASAATVTVSLDRDETRHLLRRAPAAYRTQINDLLLTALTRALAPWTGDRSLLIDLEGHGREEILPGVDLSRTVGWFTSIFPVLLDPGPDRDEGAQLKTIKEQLRAVPRRGIGFGVLRYLSERLTLGSLARPQLSFNYLGQLDADFSGLTELRPVREEVREEVGPVTGSRGRRSHLVEINAEVAGGRLRMTWTYSRNLHRDATIDGLARRFRVELRGVIAHCLAPEAGGYTPSDFPLARLDQERLDALVGTADVEDVYPLSPLQEGLLFHTLKAPRSTVYFEQLSWTFGDDLDPAALRRAWERVVERHAVLRTAFAWEGLERPLQIVDRQVEVPWEEHDWRRIDDEETRFAALLAADRRRGFDLSRAPLLRFTLVRRADGSWHLVWSHHHLLVDGWSVQLLCEEVGAFYRGDSPSLQRPRPYRDFIAWLGHGDAQQAESFWRRRLRGFAAPTPLPLESAVASASAEPREERLRLPAESSARLAAWTRRHQLTLSTLVQGAMALMLARCAGSDDVVFGVTTSGRDAALPGAEAMVGLLINTLPLRVRLAPQEPLCGWLERLQTEQLEVRRYEHTSLAQVQSWSEVSPPDPLFESILVFENYPRRAQEKDGGPHYDFEATHYPLTVIAIPGRELVLRASYAPARFAATTVARMLRHLALVLEGMASDSGIVLGALPTLSKVERHQLLVEWNDVAACPVGDCVHQRVAARAAAMPEATAVVAGDERLSYRELDRRANDLGNALRRLGAGPETAVGVSLERSPEMAVAVLAIFKAGAACVPLDPAYPRERLAFVLEEIDRAAPGPGLLLTRDRLLTEFPEQLPLSRVGGGSVWERGSGGEGSGSNPAYVIYTSGSTGRPKGVAMTHGALANLVSWQVTRAAERARATTLQFASLSFDVSFQEIFSTWCAGGELVLAGDEVRRDPAALLEVLERHAVERLFLPFVALRELAETAVERQRYPDALRRVITAGEQLQITPALRRFFAKLPHCVLENQYGPVETHVVTAFSLAGATSGWAALPPIGRPIASTELVVAGSDLRPVPLGVAGELFLGGAGLARGYLGRGSLTAERFLPHPCGRRTGERLYRTGDLVRWLPDGELEFLGRIDQQVKIRGFRVEPGEIEALLAGHPAVRAAVVVPARANKGKPRYAQQLTDLDGTAGGTRHRRRRLPLPPIEGAGSSLVAYVVVDPASRGALPAVELRAYLRRQLPDYMVPTAFVELGELPRTPSGKVDRRSLPASGRTAPSPASTPPRSPMEEMVAEIWGRVLGCEGVGAGDDFFELGGHSLLATRVASQVRRSFGVELPIRALFEEPTVARFAAHIALAIRLPGVGGGVPSPGWGEGLSGRGDRGVRVR